MAGFNTRDTVPARNQQGQKIKRNPENWRQLETINYTPGLILSSSNQVLTAQWTDAPVLHTGTPSYLSERLHPYVPSRTLRSSSFANLHIPRTNLHFGSRSFHIAAPTVWNSLPSTLRSSQTLNTFRKHLKTHLFQSPFNSPYDLSSASDSFYWMIMSLNRIFTYLLTYLLSLYYWTAIGLV